MAQESWCEGDSLFFIHALWFKDKKPIRKEKVT
jgi:hypothetical protein